MQYYRKLIIVGSRDGPLKPEIVYSSAILNKFRDVTFHDMEALTLTELNQFKKESNEPSISNT